MKTSKTTLLIIFFALLSQFELQAQLGMGKWQTHLAYNLVTQIAQSDNKIFAVSEGALFSIDKEDLDKEFYSKLNGLNDAGISRIEYDNSNKQLLIVYDNGNIDLMTTGGILNIPDLYMKQMSASKIVNQIKFYGDKAYLACDFGIMVLNMQKREVADTYYIGPNGSEVKIINTVIEKGILYAISENTIFKADANNPNLVNYQLWETETNLPGTGELKALAAYANKIIILQGDKLYSRGDDNIWTPIYTDLNINYFNISDNKLYLTHNASELYLGNESFEKTLIQGIGNVHDSEYDSKTKTSWFAAGVFGIVSQRNTDNSEPEINSYTPKGPAINTPWKMSFGGDKLFVVPGSRWSSQGLKEGIVMMYELGEWTNIRSEEIFAVTGKPSRDFMSVAVDATDNKHFFVTSYGTGLYEFMDNKFYKRHIPSNSTLESVIEAKPDDYTRLDGQAFDSKGNLFLINTNVGSAIKILDKDGVWNQLRFADATKPTMGDLLISNQNENQKWIASVRSKPGIFVYDDNGTIIDQDDDRSKFMSTFIDSDKEGLYINPTYVYCLAQDKNGVIWAGTEQGPLLFYNLSKVFDENYTCTRVKIPRNDGTDRADYLLESDKVKAIAIDGANRKWIGTESSGLYLMSENGQETIQHFTSTNSPILSNDIISLAINPISGEVFIGTSAGLVSYQSDAVDAGSEFNNVHAYPNPVRENYNGIITITGLVADTQVKITDIHGNLICQTQSNGGIATWDAKDVHGRKVNTGIYLVICANSDGTQSTITKIMVIN
jgi:hypothetical protein